MGTSGPPGGWAYTRHSWVVANDRLRATGWQPNTWRGAASRPGPEPLAADPARENADVLGALSGERGLRWYRCAVLLRPAGVLAAAVAGITWAIRRHHR